MMNFDVLHVSAKFRVLALLLLPLLLLGGCKKKDNRTEEERYAAALATGLASQERTDDLFLGISLGMRPKAFFDHCTELNRQQKITDAGGTVSVKHKLEELEKDGHLLFFPEFTKPDPASGDSAVVFAMDMEFYYDSWSPWNEEFSSVNLLRDVTRVFIDWYGDDFIAVPHEKVGRVVTQIKDNRRVSLWVKSESRVAGRIVDLSQAPDEPLVLNMGLELPSRQSTNSLPKQ